MAHRWFSMLLVAAIVAAPSARADDDPLLVSLLEAKKAFREKRWDDADASLRRLLEIAAGPGREAVLPKILPVYHFYAAAVAWQKKDEERARQELARYFEFQPDATIDPGVYAKSFCIFFDAQRTAAARRSPAPPPASAGLPDFDKILPDEGTIPQYTGDPTWPAGAVSVLMTEPEKKEFATLPGDADRREWVFRFWKKFDPEPATPENEYQKEFYRRSQYADAHFSTETVRGSQSDRGRVLLVLGPPSYIGRTALLQTNDPMTASRATTLAPVKNATGGTNIMRVPTSPYSVIAPGNAEGEIEVWHYRIDRIPKGIPFNDLQFRFITKKGYGESVFQKDDRELLSLQKAVRLLRTGS